MNTRPGTLDYELEGLVPDLQEFLGKYAATDFEGRPNTAMRLLIRVGQIDRMISPRAKPDDQYSDWGDGQ